MTTTSVGSRRRFSTASSLDYSPVPQESGRISATGGAKLIGPAFSPGESSPSHAVASTLTLRLDTRQRCHVFTTSSQPSLAGFFKFAFALSACLGLGLDQAQALPTHRRVAPHPSLRGLIHEGRVDGLGRIVLADRGESTAAEGFSEIAVATMEEPHERPLAFFFEGERSHASPSSFISQKRGELSNFLPVWDHAGLGCTGAHPLWIVALPHFRQRPVTSEGLPLDSAARDRISREERFSVICADLSTALCGPEADSRQQRCNGDTGEVTRLFRARSSGIPLEEFAQIWDAFASTIEWTGDPQKKEHPTILVLPETNVEPRSRVAEFIEAIPKLQGFAALRLAASSAEEHGEIDETRGIVIMTIPGVATVLGSSSLLPAFQRFSMDTNIEIFCTKMPDCSPLGWQSPRPRGSTVSDQLGPNVRALLDPFRVTDPMFDSARHRRVSVLADDPYFNASDPATYRKIRGSDEL